LQENYELLECVGVLAKMLEVNVEDRFTRTIDFAWGTFIAVARIDIVLFTASAGSGFIVGHPSLGIMFNNHRA
jgi:hypothetical protein